MPRLVAFLRAINVGGHTVKMDVLRGLFERMGATEVETFIASGNVIFTSPATDIGALERRVEERLGAALGYEVKTFIRTEAEVATIARYQAFTASEVRTAGAFSVGFLAAPLAAAARKSLAEIKTGVDAFHVNGRELYWLSTVRQSESTVSNVLLERALKVRVTFRGVKTVVKLADKYGLSTEAD